MEKPNSFLFNKFWFEKKRVNKGEAKVYVNQETTPFHRAYHREKLTPQQFEAAKEIEKRYLAYWQRTSQRNILDTSPRGSSVDSESQQEYALRAKEKIIEVEDVMTRTQRNIVYSVCVNYEPIGKCELRRKRYRYLVEGLDAVAKMLRLT